MEVVEMLVVLVVEVVVAVLVVAFVEMQRSFISPTVSCIEEYSAVMSIRFKTTSVPMPVAVPVAVAASVVETLALW